MENSKEYKVKLTLGDWSNDGHGKYEEIIYKSNYPVSVIRQAYKDSCKLTGVQFNHNEDYTGNGVGTKHNSPYKIWTEYEDSSILEEAYEILKKYIEFPEDYYELDLDNNIDRANLIMKFIGLSMPQDWKYEHYIDDEIEPINGWWNKDLNVQFGYGLY